MQTAELDSWTRQYLETALWSSTGDDEEPLDATYGVEDIDEPTLARATEDCRRFQDENAEDLDAHPDPTMGAHDFWLNRNGHGAGFWDGDWPEPQASRLDAAASAFGSIDLFENGDGTIGSI